MRNLTPRARLWAWFKIMASVFTIISAALWTFSVWIAPGPEWFRYFWAAFMAVVVAIYALTIWETAKGR